MSKRKRTKGEPMQPPLSKKARMGPSAPGKNQEPEADEVAHSEVNGMRHTSASPHREQIAELNLDTSAKTAAQLYGAHQNDWSIKSSVGGLLLNIDPVFTLDGQHYILAYSSGVKVFSRKESLPVQFLPKSSDGTIIGIALSPGSPQNLIVGLSNGQVDRWDWAEGTRTAVLELHNPINALAVESHDNSKVSTDIVYVTESSNNSWSITAHCFPGDDSTDQSSRAMLDSDTSIDNLQTVANGSVLLAWAGHRVLIGTKSTQSFPLARLHYRWIEFNCTGVVVSMRGRTSAVSDMANDGLAPVLDLAAGTRSGVIYVYRDIINNLHKAAQSGKLPPVVTLHWHREAVAALDWSKDGNYIISGGQETVLVLWQLDTDQKTFLPHLTAPIKRIIVSPAGTSYGVTLTDNSSMILKIMTLEPETSIAEPQLFSRDEASGMSLVHASSSNPTVPLPRWRSSIAVMSKSPKLLFSTSELGSDQSGASTNLPPFLHVYDYRSARQLSKQAIARTFVTDPNIDPQGRHLQEPNIAMLRASADEKWIASVDEWLPVGGRTHGPAALRDYRRSQQLEVLESRLRFWLWKEERRSWDLIWTVNLSQNPYNDDFEASRMVLALAENPARSEFFTLGEDLTVRAWYPRYRTRNGKTVQDDAGDLINWSCRKIGAIPMLTEKRKLETMAGCLTVSKDGSVLVASASSDDVGTVCSFDVRSGKLISSHFDKTRGPVRGLELVSSCVIALSDVFAAWDLVDGNVLHQADLSTPGLSRNQSRHYYHIACNRERDTAAVVTPTLQDESVVTIFIGKSLVVQSTFSLPFLVVAFLPAPAQRGFLAINANSEITIISGSSQPSVPVSLDGPKLPQHVGLGQIFGSTKPAEPSLVQNNAGEGIDDEAQYAKTTAKLPTQPTPAERADVLRRIFDASQPLSSPPVLSTFRQVTAVLANDSNGD